MNTAEKDRQAKLKAAEKEKQMGLKAAEKEKQMGLKAAEKEKQMGLEAAEKEKRTQSKATTKELRAEQRQQEREIFRQLKGTKKIKHFLTYYRVQVIGVLAAILVVVSMISAVKNGTGKIGLYCVLFTDSAEDYETWGINLLNQVEEVEGDRFFEQLAYFTDKDDLMKGTAETYLATRIGVREADVMIGGDYFITYTGEELDVLMSLSDIFTADELEAYGERVRYKADGTPCAVALTEDEFPEVKERPYYAAICSATTHLKESEELLRKMLHI